MKRQGIKRCLVYKVSECSREYNYKITEKLTLIRVFYITHVKLMKILMCMQNVIKLHLAFLNIKDGRTEGCMDGQREHRIHPYTLYNKLCCFNPSKFGLRCLGCMYCPILLT